MKKENELGTKTSSYYDLLCNCGCGKEIEIKKYHKRYGIPKYIIGHNSRVSSWNKGLTKEINESIKRGAEKNKTVFNNRIKFDRRPFEENKEYLCICGCNNFIKVIARHTHEGVPNYIVGHTKNFEFDWSKGLTKETDNRILKAARNKKGKVSKKKGISKYKWFDLSIDLEIYCACNCGERLTGVYPEHKLPIFIKSHSNKMLVWNRGLTSETDSRIKKVAEAKKLETNSKLKKCLRIYEENKNYFCICGCAQQIKFKRYHRINGVPNYIIGHNGKTFSNKERIRKFNLKRQFKNTKIELFIQEALFKKNIRFEKHKNIRGLPDIFIEPNICIFADGDYWHGNPNKYKDDDIIGGRIPAKYKWGKDKEVTDFLTNNGYIVLRFWEHDINNNLDKCVENIIQVISMNVTVPDSSSVGFHNLI